MMLLEGCMGSMNTWELRVGLARHDSPTRIRRVERLVVASDAMLGELVG